MGKLEIIDHDGQGKIEFVEKPFVVMQDGAYINLGQIGRDGKSLAPPKK